jgi:sugar-specific transcriptional regulator TrmB
LDWTTLEKIGLTHGEIKTYLALLKLGASSTGPIAKQSGVSRSKVYMILDKLEKKGLASHVEKSGVVYFQAVEPGKIKDYIKDQQEQLKNLEEEFDKFLPQLQAFHSQPGQTHNITVYQGMKGLKVAHEHTYLKLKRGEEYYVLGVPQYQPWEHLHYWVKDHRRRDEAGIKCKMLFNSDADRKLMKNRNSFRLSEARYMPTEIRTPAYFTIYKDTTLITIPSKDPISIEIVSNEITDAFKAYFGEFWKRSKPYKS